MLVEQRICNEQRMKISCSNNVDGKKNRKNKELWGRTHQSRIEESIKRTKWKGIGHTPWKPQNNITRSTLKWNSQGLKKKSRPKQSWRRSVQDELTKKNVTRTEAQRTAKNTVLM